MIERPNIYFPIIKLWNESKKISKSKISLISIELDFHIEFIFYVCFLSICQVVHYYFVDVRLIGYNRVNR